MRSMKCRMEGCQKINKKIKINKIMFLKKIITFFNLLSNLKFKVIYDIVNSEIPTILVLDKQSSNSVNLILNGYAHKSSFNKFDSLGNGKFPWMTYSFLDYIKNLDLTEKNVFEWGSGNSTIFWSEISKSVVSIENNKEWYVKIIDLKKHNAILCLRETKDSYVNAINENSSFYDIIVLDGYGYRYECAKEAVKKLNKGGMIILDDSDNIEYNQISHYLKSENLIQIDFIGLKPMSDFIVSTSIFIDREFNFNKKYDFQPKIFVGNQRNYIA